MTRGVEYTFRFRVKNSIGWSDFSSTVSSLVAIAPSKLSVPTLLAVDVLSIQLGLDTNVDNGGSIVISYNLEINGGIAGSAFVSVTTYQSGDLSHTVTILNDALVGGKIYTFRWYAVNLFGTGERSNEVTVALAPYPLATTSITKNMALSSKTSLSLTWSPVTAGATPGGNILGYILKAKDILNGTVWTAFDGV